MALYRSTPPEYRALVVENERDFRTELVYCVESIDAGISVVAEASDFDDALELFDQEEFDLLITDINLTDEPRFQIGVRDGTELARIARERFDVPCIFLTAFADYDPEVVRRAAASDPVGFLQKQGAEVSGQIRTLIGLAMRRLELIRRERESVQQLEAVLKHFGEAILYLDEHGHVQDFNEATTVLLGLSPEDLLDQHWEDVLPVEVAKACSEHPLRGVVEAGASGQVPIAAIKRRDGDSLLVSLYVSETEHLRKRSTMLLLRDLSQDTAQLASAQLNPGSTLAVIGLADSSSASLGDLQRNRVALLEIQSILLAYVRGDDRISRPTPLTIALMLPATDEGTGLGIINTLLSTVERELASKGNPLRLRAGVAYRDTAVSTNATVASALEALDRAQRSTQSTVLCASEKLQPRRLTDIPLANPAMDDSPFENGLILTDKVLSINPGRTENLEDLDDAIAKALTNVAGLTHYAVCTFDERGGAKWLLSRNLSDGAYTPCASELLPLGDVPSISFDLLNSVDLELLWNDSHLLAVTPLRDGDELLGAGVVFIARGNSAPRGASELESKLARAPGRHIAGLLRRSMEHSASSVPAADNSQIYNLYALLGDTPAANIARSLLEIDTPLTIVSERGMARVQFLDQAVSASKLHAERCTVILPDMWLSPDPESVLCQLILRAEHRVILFREPHEYPTAIQAAVGDMLLTRTMPKSEGRVAIPHMRLAVTLPDEPEAMMERGELHPRLASALAAGVIHLPPIVENPGEIVAWAQAILRAEARRAGRGGRLLEPSALEAIREHPWPGNVLELQSRIREAVERNDRYQIGVVDLGLFRLSAVPTDRGNDPARNAGALPGSLAQTLEAAVTLAAQMSTPPPLTQWLEDESVAFAVQRFRTDPQASTRASELLGISAEVFAQLRQRAENSSNARAGAPFWQSSRLALHRWLERTPACPGPVTEILKHGVLELIARLPNLPADAEAILIAGCSLEDYRRYVANDQRKR